MGEKLPQRFALILASILLSAPLTRAAWATPSDEKKIESEIDDEEDDGSPDMNHKAANQSPEDGLPATTTVPPPPELTPPPPVSSHQPEPEHRAPTPEQQPVMREEAPLYDGTTRATSSGRGEPIFDWSKHQNEEEVQHPFAAKGLTRITKDRTYMYRVKESDQDRAASFRVGSFHPTRLANPDEHGQVGSTFDENYGSNSTPALMFDYEWQMWRTSIGKIGIKVGTGAFVAQGNGHFVQNSTGVNAGLTPREIFTFAVVPLNLGAVYRLQFWHRQMVVPYGEGGGTVFGFGEFRDDNKGPKFGGSLGAYVAGGLALNMTYFDALSRIALDREYGINAVYLTVEFRQLVSITQRYDLTSNLVNAGFLMEY